MSILWSDEEINFLKENYESKTYKEISFILNRSDSSVEKKIKRLGLYKKNTNDYTYWSDNKLLFLIENYNNYSCKDLGELLGFTEKKIIKKLSLLKLKKKRFNKKNEKKDVVIKNTNNIGHIKCEICNGLFKNLKGLNIHISTNHKDIDVESYYILYNIGNVKKCRICGEKGRFVSLSKGYRDLCLSVNCISKSHETGSIKFWIDKGYSEEYAKIMFDEYTKKRLRSLKDGDILRLNVNPNYYKEKSHNSKEYWIKKGYNYEDSLKMSSNVMKNMNIKSSLIFKSNPEKYASKYPTKIEYYLSRGYTEEQGRALIYERQKTFTLEKLIKKYGEERASEIYNNRQEKWLKSLHKNGNLKSGYSLISQELFRKIDEYIPNNKFQWKLKNGEFIIKKYAVDFIDHETKRIIEFNGDIYHANPKIYSEYDTPNPWDKKLMAKEIWESENNRNKLISDLGYEMLIVWESDYREDPETTIKRCINFLNDEKFIL